MNRRLFAFYSLIILVVVLRIFTVTKPEPFPNGTSHHSVTRIQKTPQLTATHQQLQVTLEGRQVTLLLPRFSTYSYGQKIAVDGTVKMSVLASGRTVSSISFPKITILEDPFWFPFFTAGWVREHVTAAFQRSLPPDHVSLLLGVVFGIDHGFSSEVKEAFQTAGVMHVIAASGMNVTLLAGFLLPFFLRFLKRNHALAAVVLFLIFYAVLSGLSASIVRATIMAGIGFLGLVLGRQRTSFVSLFLTGCIMLIITPTIVSDIGFQLSFAATFGIIVLRPLLAPLFEKRLPIFLRDDLSSTLAAQITTLPLLLFYFHSVGLLSVLVNMLVLWTIPPMMVLGSLAGMVALVSSTLGSLIAFLAEPFLQYFLIVVTVLHGFSPTLSIMTLPVSLVAAYYLLLSSILLRIHRQKA